MRAEENCYWLSVASGWNELVYLYIHTHIYKYRKIIELVFVSNLKKHGNTNNIVYPLQVQHGFREDLSCETQLLEFVDDISRNTSMQLGKQTGQLVNLLPDHNSKHFWARTSNLHLIIVLYES